MHTHYIPFDETGTFSKSDKAYILEDPKLSEFYIHSPSISSFEEVIKIKEKQAVNRKVLVDVLKEQHKAYPNFEASRNNIEKLILPQTFTITTAHQPSLFTGPLYFIYKIISTINLCENLSNAYPEYYFVPIFWSGAEDHDFEEINHVKVFREKLVWENDEDGSVGNMSIDGILPLLPKLKEILGDSQNAHIIYQKLENAFQNQTTYGKAALSFIHSLFGEKGLVVLDPSDPKLKELAIPLFEKEILEQPSKRLVEAIQEQLVSKGFKAQAHARKINLFFTQKGARERIDYQDIKYTILNQNIVYNQDEIIQLLKEHPEQFSPNVIMRPLYQELILPNLAYIGGGGELAYWLERKSQFEYFGIPYPMLIRRDSVLWVDKNSIKKMKSLGISLDDLWNEEHILINNLVKKISDEEINISSEREKILRIFEDLLQKGERIDSTLIKSIEGEKAKVNKGLDNIEQKMMRAEKRKHEVITQKLSNLKKQLFPEGNLQERKDNFLSFYVRNGETFFDMLYQNLDPMDKRVKVIVEAMPEELS